MTTLRAGTGAERRGLSDPAQCRDRTPDHHAFWSERREAELRPLVTPELIAEHERDPAGERHDHSHDLQKLLTYLRCQPSVGKAFILTERGFESYRVGILAGRDQPVSFPDERRYASEQEAAHAIFLRRLADVGVDVAALTGGAR